MLLRKISLTRSKAPSTAFLKNWDFEVLILVEGEKPQNPEKSLGARTTTNKQR